MRAKPWDLHGFRLPNGLRVVHVAHPHLGDGCAVTLTVPVGTRRVPFGVGAVVAAHLGDAPAPELGQSAVRWTIAGELSEALDRADAAISAPMPGPDGIAALWARVQRLAAQHAAAPAVVALNAAHAAVFPADSSYTAPWPAPVGGPPPSRAELDSAWRRLDTRTSHLVIATRAPAQAVEAAVRAHGIGRDTHHRSRVRVEERGTAIRAATPFLCARPVIAPGGGSGVLAGVAVPLRGSHGGDYLLPYLARVTMPDGLHSSVWPHYTASVWAIWGVAAEVDAVGGAVALRAAADAYRAVAVTALNRATARHLGYSLEADLRRIAQSPELLAKHVAALQGAYAPPSPPLPPFNPDGFARRLQRLALGVGAPRPFLAGSGALDRRVAVEVCDTLARDTEAASGQPSGCDRPRRAQQVRPPSNADRRPPG